MYTNSRSFLGQHITIKIDRPMSSYHPEHDILYPVNYGYVPNTIAPDGKELDAYVLGIFKPVEEYTGHCIAVLHRLDDDDDKLIIVPTGKMYTDEQIKALTEFKERFFNSTIWRE